MTKLQIFFKSGFTPLAQSGERPQTTASVFGSDRFQESEKKLSENDLCFQFSRELEDLSFFERNKGTYQITNFYSQYFPLLSGLTLFACVFFLGTLGRTYEFFHGELKLGEYLLILVGLVGSVFLIIMNESKKTSSLKSFYKAKALNRPPLRIVRNTAIVTCFISILGSAFGMFSLAYSINDKSHSIKETSQAQRMGVNATFSSDSLRIVQMYQPTIDQKRETISQFHASKFRTKRDNLNNEIIALTREMENKLKEERERVATEKSSINDQEFNQLSSNKNTTIQAAVISFLVLLIMEIVNIVSHAFNWKFKTKVVVESEFQLAEGNESLIMQMSPTPLQSIPHQSNISTGGIGYPKNVPPIDTPINTPPQISKEVLEGAGKVDGIGEDDVEFLRKYIHVVKAILAGKGYGAIVKDCNVSKTTAQNVRRTMKAVKMI